MRVLVGSHQRRCEPLLIRLLRRLLLLLLLSALLCGQSTSAARLNATAQQHLSLQQQHREQGSRRLLSQRSSRLCRGPTLYLLPCRQMLLCCGRQQCCRSLWVQAALPGCPFSLLQKRVHRQGGRKRCHGCRPAAAWAGVAVCCRLLLRLL